MGGRDVPTRPETRNAGFPSLATFDRLAPPPVADEVLGEIDGWTKPGEIVIDITGRGGWIARAAVGQQRRAVDFETNPLTRLLAEVVLRPPDVRHLDAAVQGIGAAGLGGSSVRSTIDALFASRCPTCGRTVPLESLIWEATGGTTRAIRREYRCQPCREQLGGPDLRHAEPEHGDLELALSVEPRGPVWEALKRRFPVPRPDHPLPEQLLGLHTPRQLLGLHAILDRIDGELRAAPITAALRLSLLNAITTASRLNSYPGRHATVRVNAGALKPPSSAQWRERNPWLAFEDSYRSIRAFVQRLEAAGDRGGVPRFGSDLLALEEGTANVSVGEATASNLRRLIVQGERIAVSGKPSRVRLALGQPPLRMTPERLAATYHGTAWVLGAEAASMLPLDDLFGPARKPDVDADIVEQARSLAVVAPALAPSAHAVIVLDTASPATLVGTVLAGEAARYRLADVRIHSRRGDGTGTSSVAFVPPGGVLAPGPRTRANRLLPPVSGGTGDPRTVPGRGLFSPPERLDEGVYKPSVARQVVTETAIEVLKARGEPATFDQLLPDLLLGLDRSGQLARLARRWAVIVADPLDEAPAAIVASAAAAADAAAAAAPGSTGRSAAGTTAPDQERGAAEALLELIREELDAPTNRRLCQVEAGQYWLAAQDDRAEAASPIGDRVEWAAFGMLSASRQLSESTFFERMASLFPGRDAPDESLLRAVLDSYRSPTSTIDEVICLEQLEARSREHDELIAELADAGHRLGLRVWIGRRQQSRRVHGRPLSAWLDEEERHAHLPLIARGPEEELERVDCAWYVPHKASFLFEVEWTAMLSEPLLVRHVRIPPDEKLVRFLVVPAERADLIRFKLGRSGLLQEAIEAGNWHFLKWNQLRQFVALETPSLDGLEPFLGLEPAAEGSGEQLALFEADQRA